MSASAIGLNPSSEAGNRFSINNSSWATLQGYMRRLTGENISLEFVEYFEGQGFLEAEVSAKDAQAIADRLHAVLESGEVRRSLQAEVDKAKAREAFWCEFESGRGALLPHPEGPDVDAWEEVLREWADFLRDCGGCSVSQY